MDSLVQAIKNLDQLTFQQLCFQLMHEKHPSAKIRYVEGASGDEGADLFRGNLSVDPTVWQCKAFQLTILGDSQKDQIRKSLRDAVKNLRPKLWILCLNMNLDTKAHRWFQRLQQSYATQGVTIADPVQGVDLARELMFRRTLRNHYFPGLAIDPMELRGLVAGTDNLDDASLEKRASENVEQWLERIQAKDPRFSYEIIFGGDRGAATFPPKHEPGLVAAITDGRKIIKAFARDVEALRLDPAGFEFHISQDGTHKVLDLIRTGREQHWGPQEILGFASTLPLLSGVRFEPDKMNVIARSLPDQKIIPLRLTFKNDAATVCLEYLEFKKTRQGTDEVEIASIDDNPLQLTLVLPSGRSCLAKATIAKHLVGKRIRPIAPVCRALQLLQNGCEIEIFALQLNAKLGLMYVAPLDLGLKPGFFAFINDLLMISTHFDTDFVLPGPDKFTEDDEKTFRFVRAFVHNEPLQLDDVTLRIIKSPANAKTLPEQLGKTSAFRMEHDGATATLFGSTLNIGPCAIQISEAEIKNHAQSMARFRQASIGDSVPISLRPLSPVQFLLHE